MSQQSNPKLEFAAFLIIVVLLFFDFIMNLILKAMGYAAIIIGCILGASAAIGLVWRIIRGIGNLFRRRQYQEMMSFVSGEEREAGHGRP